ncbi:hypothetical protein OJAV_G00202640 [Oryzias javanicus]|uniref:Fibronectin type-III domain-containing protein n=1 Tax=Oryzias javanicus TaxID=123683 RepID=A0A437C572_ORYJA|nr:hypothetical protein OJAV_G00202640 [Oryzias javanicus]
MWTRIRTLTLAWELHAGRCSTADGRAAAPPGGHPQQDNCTRGAFRTLPPGSADSIRHAQLFDVVKFCFSGGSSSESHSRPRASLRIIWLFWVLVAVPDQSRSSCCPGRTLRVRRVLQARAPPEASRCSDRPGVRGLRTGPRMEPRTSFLLFLFCLARIPGSAPVFLPAPVNLSVDSRNFFPTLRWDPGPGTPAGTEYTVFKRVNTKPFKQLPRPTHQTSVVLKLNASKMFRMFRFRVAANFNGSRSAESEVSFDPYTDNEVGPLKLTLSECGTCLRVNISLPEVDRHSGVKDVQKFYDFIFKVFWRKGQQGKVEEMTTPNKTVTLDNLRGGVEYCVQADISSINPKKTIPSAWSCAFTGPAENETGSGGAGVSPVVTSLIPLFILSAMVLSGLHYTGFLCDLKARRPSALKTRPAKAVFTPDKTFLDPVSIAPHVTQQKLQLLRASLTSSEDEEEEGVEPLYMDRVPELSSGENSELESCGGSGEGREAAENVFKSLKASAEEEEVHEDDEDGTEADEEEGGIAGTSSQTGVQEEEEERRIPEIFSNVNLVSVVLASLTAGDEDEEEERKDFLKHLSRDGSGTPSEDQVCVLLLQPAEGEEEEEEGSRAHGAMQSEEEEEEEEFSEYLRHG